MFTKTIGSGQDHCFAIPGWGEDHTAFQPLERFLEAQATVHAVDPPGYGSSPQPVPFTVECITQMLAEAYNKCCRQAARSINTLAGNCSGAILAAELALYLEPPPSRLLFIDPFAFLPDYFRVFLRKGYGKMAYQSTFASPVGRWITNRLLSGRQDSTTDMMETFRVVDHEVTYKYLQVFGCLDSIEKYKELRCEVTIITGSRTFAAVRKSVQMWKELWPQAEIAEIANSGHLPIRETPQELVQAMFAYIGKKKAGSP